MPLAQQVWCPAGPQEVLVSLSSFGVDLAKCITAVKHKADSVRVDYLLSGPGA